MNIAVDCRWITTDTGGIRQYTLNLVKNLLLIDRVNKYFLLYDTEETKQIILEKIKEKNDRVNFVHASYGPFSLKNQILLPLILKKNKIVLFHSTNFMLPFFISKCKTIITVHDLIPYLFPQWCYGSKKIRIYPVYKKLTEWVLQKSDFIITDSENSKSDIEKSIPGCKNKIKSIYVGISDENFKRIDDRNKILQFKIKFKLSTDVKFVLYVGRQDPYKNIIGLVKAFYLLQKKINNVQLIVAGKKDNRYLEPHNLIKEYNIENKVLFTGVISNEDLLLLYNSADIFVFPSFYEGFGLPPLEAMACGLPVITSNTSSLPEVVGDAAIKVNPNNIEELSEQMCRLLTDNRLQDILRKKGFEQVKKFTWDKCAQETLKIYESMRLPRSQIATSQ